VRVIVAVAPFWRQTRTVCEDTTLDAACMRCARGRELTGLLCGCDVTDALHRHDNKADEHSYEEQQRISTMHSPDALQMDRSVILEALLVPGSVADV